MPDDGRRYLDAGVLNRITPLGLRARQTMEGAVSGGHRSPLQGVSPEFADHREYVPGDDLKHLDWKVLARAERYVVKRYEEESNLRCTFVVDASGSMSYGEARRHEGTEARRGEGGVGSSKYDVAATVAACLGSVLMRQRDAVGVVTFDHGMKEALPAKANTRHFGRVLEALDGAGVPGSDGSTRKGTPIDGGRGLRKASDHGTDGFGAGGISGGASGEGETEVGAALVEVAEAAGRGGMVVLLSDLLCDLDQLSEGLQRLRHGRHEVVVMQVLHGDEIELPFNESIVFKDIEAAGRGGAEVYGEPWAFRRAYREEMLRFIGEAAARCRGLGMDHVLLRGDEDVGAALSRYLHGRRAPVTAPGTAPGTASGRGAR